MGEQRERQVALWDAVHRYVRACGGDPDRGVYGATERQAAVAAVEAVALPVDLRLEPRPRVRWEPPRDTDPRPCWRAILAGHTLGAVWLDPWVAWAWTSLDYAKHDCDDPREGLTALRAHLISHGFDVDEIPEVPRGD